MRLRFLVLLMLCSGMGPCHPRPGADRVFVKIDVWRHHQLFYGFFLNATITHDDELILLIHKHGIKAADKNRLYDFARIGNGPDEVNHSSSVCLYKDQVAETELYRKVQIFAKKRQGYKWERNIWRQEKGCFQRVSSARFIRNKWYFAGMEYDYEQSPKGVYYLLRICEENGKFIKRLVRRKYKEPRRLNLMGFYLAEYKRRVLFLGEDEPTVHEISQDSLQVIRKVKLRVPGFFKPMPADYYAREINRDGENFSIPVFYRALERWKSTYSRITNMLIEKGRFIIQIRTASDDRPRFALLFYHLPSFDFEKMIFTNDYLLTSRSGKFYMFQNGNPMIDEEAGEFIVNVYDYSPKEEPSIKTN